MLNVVPKVVSHPCPAEKRLNSRSALRKGWGALKQVSNPMADVYEGPCIQEGSGDQYLPLWLGLKFSSDLLQGHPDAWPNHITHC
jgi:hypothetical protein